MLKLASELIEKYRFVKMCQRRHCVFMEDVRAVVPDATHMIVRCVERDLKRMAQRIVNDKHPYETDFVRTFEHNLTMREVKKPYFLFGRTTPQNKPGKVSKVSLSGSEALTAIADDEELQEASNEIKPLYEGVWTTGELVSGTGNSQFGNCVRVLKEKFPRLFQHNGGRISMYDASELLRKSLNRCAILLRESKNGLAIEEYSHWAEVYYQTSMLLFDEKGLTPYKLKLVLIPWLVKSGHVESPWFHMCEGLEKSNHHAHKDFQTRTMRGGGRIHHQDPMFLEVCFSFCKFMALAKPSNTDCTELMGRLSQAVHGCPIENLPAPSYLAICKKPCPDPKIAVGEARERGMLLAGMRFFVAGGFAKTDAEKYGKQMTPQLQPQETVQRWIKQLGGELLKKSAMLTLLHGNSRTPHCFVVLKDAEELNKGTMTKAELEAVAAAKEAADIAAGKKPKKSRGQRSAATESDTGSIKGNASEPEKLHPTALLCRELAVGDFTFLKLAYITESRASDVVLDPYLDQYKLVPGSYVKKVTVRDVRPLLLLQTSQEGTSTRTSTIVALKRYRKKMANADGTGEVAEVAEVAELEQDTGDESVEDTGEDSDRAESTDDSEETEDTEMMSRTTSLSTKKTTSSRNRLRPLQSTPGDLTKTGRAHTKNIRFFKVSDFAILNFWIFLFIELEHFLT